MPRIGDTDLDVHALCLGGNVFGWTTDVEQSVSVLDAYVASGGNFIDTADVYSDWKPGNEGGESERIIGQWMAARSNRDSVIIATKVGKLSTARGLSAGTISAACDASLRRLQTDHIDLYYAHADDPTVPLDETLGAFDALVQVGKVRHIAASNYSAERLAEVAKISERDGGARFVALQPHYNLVERDEYEGPLREAVAGAAMSCVPYYALASGFLTGAYRRGEEQSHVSQRAGAARAYLDERGERVLGALDSVAKDRTTTVAAVALAWLAAQPTVASPIASARTVEQLAELLPMADLRLSEEELGSLDQASATPG